MKLFAPCVLLVFISATVIAKRHDRNARAGMSCDDITQYYADLGKRVGACLLDNGTQTFYWEILNGENWGDAKFICGSYNDKISALAIVRNAAELAILERLLPNGNLRNHWLNFRLDSSQGKTMIEALVNHGFQWENGTPFTFHQGWRNTMCGGTDCSNGNGQFPGCMHITGGSDFFFDDCNNPIQPLCSWKP